MTHRQFSYRRLSHILTAIFGSVALLMGTSACSAPVATGSTSLTAQSSLPVSRQCDQEAATAEKMGSLSSGFPLSLMAYSAAHASNMWVHIADQCPARFGSSSLQAARADASAHTYASLAHQSAPNDAVSTAQQDQRNLSRPSASSSSTSVSSSSSSLPLSQSDAAVFSLSFDRLAFSEEFLAARSDSLRSRYLPASQSHRQIAALLQHIAVPGSQCSQLSSGTSADSSNSRLTCQTDSRQRLYSAARLAQVGNPRATVTDTMTGIPASLPAVLLMEAGLESAQSAGLSSSDSSAQRCTAAAWAAGLMSSAFSAGYPFFTPAAR